MKEIPVLYNRKEECCGCTACYAICPKEAITMVEDEEGFEYPKIDESRCIRCYKCLTVCPIKESKRQNLNLMRWLIDIEYDMTIHSGGAYDCYGDN